MGISTRRLPLVKLLATGGTIAGKGTSPLANEDYVPGVFSANDLLAQLPGVEKFIRIDAEQILNTASSKISTSQLVNIGKRINRIITNEPEVDGIVITHGTDTLEETAFFLHLTVKSSKPVVVVGAMRPATAISADGPMNLYEALLVASCPEARGLGVLVVMNDKIDSARDVSKSLARGVEAFISRDLGPLGFVEKGKVFLYRKPLRRHTINSEFDISNINDLPRVDIIYSYLGADSAMLQGAIDAGAKGIVIAATGYGTTSLEISNACKKLNAKGFPIVFASRTGARCVITDSCNHYLVGADNINPQKARILLSLAISKNRTSTEDLQYFFSTY